MVEKGLKLDVGSGFVMPDLTTAEGVAAVVEGGETTFEATYFDTPDHRLAAVGVTLRRRTKGDDVGWHLRLPTGAEPDARHEIRLGLGRAVRTVPKRLRTTVAGVAGDQPLKPVTTVTTHRTVHRLLDDDGVVLTEVVEDTVEASLLPPRSATDDGAETTSWREVEVALVGGGSSLLDEVVHELAEAGADRAAGRSTLDRVLGGEPAPPAAPTRRKDPVQALVQHRLTTQLDVFLRREPLAREDLPDGVHSTRVAVRRLRSALATFRPFLDRTVTDPLRDELGWFSDALGRVRDADVLREHLDQAIAELTDARPDIDWHDGRLRAQLSSFLARRREAARDDLDTVFASDRYAALVDRLRQLSAAPPWTECASRKVGGAYHRRVEHDLRRMERRMTAPEEPGLTPAERNHALHQARKAAKRARYATEPLRPVFGGRAKKAVKRLKKLQSTLGEHHDAVVVRDYLVSLSEDDTALEPAAAVLVGALLERESREADDHEAAARHAWQRFRAVSLR